MGVMADHQKRHAGCGSPHQHARRRLDAGQIPDAGIGQAQMRVAGQQGRAGIGVAAVHRPGVRRFGGQGKRIGEDGQAIEQALPHRRLNLRRRRAVRRRHASLGRPKLQQLVRRHPAGQGRTGQLRPVAVRQPERHGLAPQQTVHRRPRLGLAQAQSLQAGQAAPFSNPRVHPGGIRGQDRFQLRRQRSIRALGMLVLAQGTGQAVHLQRKRAHDLGQTAGRCTAHQLHLEHPVAGMQIAQTRGRIGFGGGMNARDAPTIERDIDRCREPPQMHRAVRRRQTQPQHQPHAECQNQRKDQQPSQPRPGMPGRAGPVAESGGSGRQDRQPSGC